MDSKAAAVSVTHFVNSAREGCISTTLPGCGTSEMGRPLPYAPVPPPPSCRKPELIKPCESGTSARDTGCCWKSAISPTLSLGAFGSSSMTYGSTGSAMDFSTTLGSPVNCGLRQSVTLFANPPTLINNCYSPPNLMNPIVGNMDLGQQQLYDIQKQPQRECSSESSRRQSTVKDVSTAAGSCTDLNSIRATVNHMHPSSVVPPPHGSSTSNGSEASSLSYAVHSVSPLVLQSNPNAPLHFSANSNHNTTFPLKCLVSDGTSTWAQPCEVNNGSDATGTPNYSGSRPPGRVDTLRMATSGIPHHVVSPMLPEGYALYATGPSKGTSSSSPHLAGGYHLLNHPYSIPHSPYPSAATGAGRCTAKSSGNPATANPAAGYAASSTDASLPHPLDEDRLRMVSGAVMDGDGLFRRPAMEPGTSLPTDGDGGSAPVVMPPSASAVEHHRGSSSHDAPVHPRPQNAQHTRGDAAREESSQASSLVRVGTVGCRDFPRRSANVHGALAGSVPYIPYAADGQPVFAAPCLLTPTASRGGAAMGAGRGAAEDLDSAGHPAAAAECPGLASSQHPTVLLPIFFQMFPCEQRDRGGILNRVISSVYTHFIRPRSLAAESATATTLGVVEGVEARSETSFVALVRTHAVWHLIYTLRCRVLMDRHGFWFAETIQQFRIMKEYCEGVRRLPQYTRHYQTDGLPCMPLVVELSRSVERSSVAAPPSPPCFDEVIPIAAVDRHRCRNGNSNATSTGSSHAGHGSSKRKPQKPQQQKGGAVQLTMAVSPMAETRHGVAPAIFILQPSPTPRMILNSIPGGDDNTNSSGFPSHEGGSLCAPSKACPNGMVMPNSTFVQLTPTLFPPSGPYHTGTTAMMVPELFYAQPPPPPPGTAHAPAGATSHPTVLYLSSNRLTL